MGRTGRMFAFEHYGIEPDIIVLGKALGVYCPMAATIFSEKVSRTFDDHIFGHGQSFSGHALGAAAALASIDVLHDDGLLERTRELGDYLGERLRALAGAHRLRRRRARLGLFWTMELVRDRATKEPLRRATEKYERTIVKDVSEYLFRERDIYVPSDKFGLWIVPPLVVTRDELDWVCAAIDDALALADRLIEGQAGTAPRERARRHAFSGRTRATPRDRSAGGGAGTMNLSAAIGARGFRRWYERQLVESFAYLTTGVLSLIMMAVASRCWSSAPRRRGSSRSSRSAWPAARSASSRGGGSTSCSFAPNTLPSGPSAQAARLRQVHAAFLARSAGRPRRLRARRPLPRLRQRMDDALVS